MKQPEQLHASDLPSVDAELASAGWTLDEDGDGIAKTFVFKTFVDAMAFMNQAAWQAERADHHPERCNVYNRVDVRLTTHDAGGLTERDLALARHMENVAAFVGIKDGAAI